MNTILEALQEIVGPADFYIQSGSYNGTWDYGSMCEYFAGVVVLVVVIASVFRFLGKLVSR